MNREQMMRRAAEILEHNGGGYLWSQHRAKELLDAILPQVTTVEAADDLPEAAVVTDESAGAWAHTPFDSDGFSWWDTSGDAWRTEDLLANFGPLTVVWTPS